MENDQKVIGFVTFENAGTIIELELGQMYIGPKGTPAPVPGEPMNSAWQPVGNLSSGAWKTVAFSETSRQHACFEIENGICIGCGRKMCSVCGIPEYECDGETNHG